MVRRARRGRRGPTSQPAGKGFARLYEKYDPGPFPRLDDNPRAGSRSVIPHPAMSAPPRLLQVFNRYLHKGGEENSVDRIFDVLKGVLPIDRCIFSSSDWVQQGPPVWTRAARLLYNPTSIRRLRAKHAAHQADAWLVHNVFPVGSAGVFREALRQRVPVIYYIHNFRPFSVSGYLWAGNAVARGGLQRRFGREILHGAWQDSRLKTAWLALVLQATHRLGWFGSVKAWVAISEFMRQRFIEAGVPAESIFTVPHFWRSDLRCAPSASEGYFLFLGRLVEAKGVRVLLEAWERLRLSLGDKTPRLVLAGAGPLEREVRERCARSPSMEFAGSVNGAAKDRLIDGCTAMIVPSISWEALGVVTYEAFERFKPVLTARSGGLPETVRHGETGLVHEPGSAAELAEHVLRLHREPAMGQAMGVAGQRWLLAHTGEELWLRRFRRVLAHVAGAPSPDIS
jgi:glycosyltransferase involved in cell wall biosynthesis